MAFLKFNKEELVNLSYSLKREIISSNKTGAYCNTSIVTCNTRRYHGLLAVTLDRFGGQRYMMLSSLDEKLVVSGKQFNLGIHCYGDIYEPRGHKYIVDSGPDALPQVTFKVGEILFRKTIILVPDKDQVLLRYELLEAPSEVELQLKPFLAFRNIHDLTHRNDDADLGYQTVEGGVSFRMYEAFPDLFLQMSDPAAEYVSDPNWNLNITYSDEYRRGFDCREDLYTPGHFSVALKPGASVVFSASMKLEKPSEFVPDFDRLHASAWELDTYEGQLKHCARTLINAHNGRKKIDAGLSWLYSGLLRETIQTLPGIALLGLGSASDFEEILDNLIADEQERLTRRTTQVEAPLYLAVALQKYIKWGADEEKVWAKYGQMLCAVIESYTPGHRFEVAMHPNGLLWAQMDGVALSWMNAYIEGRAVTERAGYQIETNALWYNAICFAVEMDNKYSKNAEFAARWTPIRDMIKANFQPMFWDEHSRRLADYVDNNGRNMDVRPNQIYAVWVDNSPLDEEITPKVLKVIETELVTARGLRSLSPRDEKYRGVYEGSQYERDLAYHQGSAHPFLLEPYIETAFRVKGASFYKRAEWLVEGFFADLSKHGVGAFSELYDGDPPFEAHGAVSSARSTAALLCVLDVMKKYEEGNK